MNSFETWQVFLGIIQSMILLGAFLGALYVGMKQNEINNRILSLQDYVAISAVPDQRSGKINLLNTGKLNLYLHGFDMLENKQRFDKARLISAGTNEASYYWIDPPPNLETIEVFPYEFKFKLYLKDEFGQKWISENGGEVNKVKIKNDEGEADGFTIKVWSYKTYKNNWKFE